MRGFVASTQIMIEIPSRMCSMCGDIMKTPAATIARVLFAAFLALAWSGALSAEDVPAAPPAEKKAESPEVKQPDAVKKESHAEKAPDTVVNEKKEEKATPPAVKAPAAKKPAAPAKRPARKKPPAKKAPAKGALAPAKPVEKAKEAAPGDKKPDDGKEGPAPKDAKPADKKPAAKKRLEKRAAEKKPAPQPKKEAVKETEPKADLGPPAAYYRVMRADADDPAFADWSAPRTAAELRNWAKTQGLVLVDDAPPVSVGKARFVERYGSTLLLDGLNRNSKYRLFLDFVAFDDSSRFSEPAALEIYADGLLLKRVSFSELGSRRNPMVLEIPYQLALDGTVTVLFRQSGGAAGFFGLWDAVLTDQYALPASFEGPAPKRAEPKSMRIKDDVIEAKPALKKRPAKLPPAKKKDAPAEKAAPKDTPAKKKDDASKIGEAPVIKRPDGENKPKDAEKPASDEARKEPAAPEIKDTPGVKDPAAPAGPSEPRKPE